MATLYRKYRPQNFKETVGQNHVKLTLQNEIQARNIANAYLFCGPRAVGKTTLARVFSKAINCLNIKKGEYDPCNKCDICKEITNSRSLDIIEIDAASHTGVDNVRENIIASARTSPSRCKYKVFIIDEVHMLSISAFNALLKIIEEPPSHVVFILCTTEVHKVPTTIISRCQRFDFKRVSINDIVKKLNYIIKKENIKISNSILESIARQSEGHMRDAESLLGQIIAIGGNEITQEEADLVIPRSDLSEIVNLISSLSKKNCAGGIRIINKLIDDGVDLKFFLRDLIDVLRKIMLGKINPSLGEKLGVEFGETLEIKINDVSKNLSISQIAVFIEKFIEARNKVKSSFIIQLPVELAIAELCGATSSEAQTNFPIKPKNVSPPINTNSNFINTKLEKKSFDQIANINIENIVEKWNEVLTKIKKDNHSLSFILRVCEPRSINGNRLCLAFKYKFHKDRVENMEIKSLVENVLSDVYGCRIIVDAITDELLEVNGNNGLNKINNVVQNENDKNEKIVVDDKNQSGGNMIDGLLKTFGGKIIK